jgi:glutamate/aspartate transport system substrate-binding protein
VTARLTIPVVFAALLTTTAACAGALDDIREKGVITLGYVEGAAPFSSADSNKEPQGYSIDICRAVAEGIGSQLGVAGLKTRWVPLSIQNRLQAVRERRVDIDCSTTTWTLTRQKDVDFSLIIFVDGTTIVALGDSEVRRFVDFKGKRIGVIRGTTTADVLARALQGQSVAAEVVPVANRAEGLQLLHARKVDGFASDRVALIESVMRDSVKAPLRLMDDDFSLEQYALALPRGDHDFRLAVNRVLARLYRSGEIMRIYDRWLGNFGRPSTLLYATYFLQSIAE